MIESRFFTDEERQARLVEATLAGDVKTCGSLFGPGRCQRKFIAYEPPDILTGRAILTALTFHNCPSCAIRRVTREWEVVSNAPREDRRYVEDLREAIAYLEKVEWEQRWIPN